MSKKIKESYVFSLVKVNEKPTIENVKYPKSILIPCIDEIYDEEEEENRIIRYLPGEKSIFLDQQTNQDLNKRASITFFNGHLIVDRRQKQLLDFLRASNANSTNKNRMPGTKAVYKEYIDGENATERINLDKTTLQAKQAAYDLGIDELIGYARVLGLDVNRDPAEVRYHMSVIAAENPTKFMKGINNPSTKRKHYLFLAVDAGIITISKGDNSVRWTDTKVAIVQAPNGIQPIDHMVDYTFDPEGEKVYEHIRTLLKPKSSEPKAESTGPDYIGMSATELFEAALEAGVIGTKSNDVFHVKGQNIAKGKENVITAIEEKGNLKRKIVTAMEAS